MPASSRSSAGPPGRHRPTPSPPPLLLLRTAIWGEPADPVYFSVDQPSDQFGSFGHPESAVCGRELDAKLVALLEHLQVRVPDRAAGLARSPRRPVRRLENC